MGYGWSFINWIPLHPLLLICSDEIFEVGWALRAFGPGSHNAVCSAQMTPLISTATNHSGSEMPLSHLFTAGVWWPSLSSVRAPGNSSRIRGENLGQGLINASVRAREGQYCPGDLLLSSKQITSFSLLKLCPGYIFNLHPSLTFLLFCRMILGSPKAPGGLFGQWKSWNCGKTSTKSQAKGVFCLWNYPAFSTGTWTWK